MLRPTIVAFVFLASVPASAQDENPLVEVGAQQYDELRYEEALQTLSAAIVRGGTLQERTELYRLLAFTYLALGREAEAEGAYRILLGLAPDYSPGTEFSPRIREFFAGVRERWEADGRPGTPPPAPVTIRHRSPAQAERGEEVELTAEIDDPSGRVSSVVLAYRQGTEDVFRRADAASPDGTTYRAVIPSEAVAPPLVEYYFEGLDGSNLPIASRGDVAAPLRIAVPAEEGGSILGEWWFWVIAGVVVAGAVTTGILLAGGGGGQEQGTFIITVR